MSGQQAHHHSSIELRREDDSEGDADRLLHDIDVDVTGRLHESALQRHSSSSKMQSAAGRGERRAAAVVVRRRSRGRRLAKARHDDVHRRDVRSILPPQYGRMLRRLCGPFGVDGIRTVRTHADVFEVRRPVEIRPQGQALRHLPTRDRRRVLHETRREFHEETDAGAVSRIAGATGWNRARAIGCRATGGTRIPSLVRHQWILR